MVIMKEPGMTLEKKMKNILINPNSEEFFSARLYECIGEKRWEEKSTKKMVIPFGDPRRVILGGGKNPVGFKYMVEV